MGVFVDADIGLRAQHDVITAPDVPTSPDVDLRIQYGTYVAHGNGGAGAAYR